MSKQQKVHKIKRKLVKISGSRYMSIPAKLFKKPRMRFIPIIGVIDTQGEFAEVEYDANKRKKIKKSFRIEKEY